MECPKVLEIFWFIDGKLSKVQEQNFIRHFENCPGCQNLHREAKRFFEGRMGMIVEGDKTACVSDGSLVRVIRMESSFEENRLVEEHLKKCKRCLKRFADFYTHRLSQEEVLKKEALEEKAKMEESESSIYADKMERVKWWKEGEIVFLGLRFSKLALAIYGGLFVFCVLALLAFLNFYFLEGEENPLPSRSSSNASSSTSQKDSSSVPSFVESPKTSSKVEFSLAIYTGELLWVQKKAHKVLEVGRHKLSPRGRFLLEEGQEVKFGLGNLFCSLFGPAEFTIQIFPTKAVIVWTLGTGLVRGFSNKRNVEIWIPRKGGRLRLQVGTAQGILHVTEKGKFLFPLRGRILYFEKFQKKLTRLGKVYRIQEESVTPVSIENPPEWYFRFFRERIPLVSGLDHFKRKGRGVFEVLHLGGEKVWQIISKEGISLSSFLFPLEPKTAYLLRWTYRTSKQLSPVKVFLIVKGKDEKVLRAYPLGSSSLWKEEEHLLFTSFKARQPFSVQLRLVLSGAGRIEFRDFSMLKFSLPRYEIYQLEKDPHFLRSVKVLEGVFYRKGKILVAKAGFQPARLEIPKLPKNYFFLQFQVGLATLWAVVFDRHKGTRQVFLFDPGKEKIRYFRYEEGVEKEVASYSFPYPRPPYRFRVFFNGSFYFLEQNGEFITQVPLLQKEPRVEVFIPPETKQYFYQLDLYQN